MVTVAAALFPGLLVARPLVGCAGPLRAAPAGDGAGRGVRLRGLGGDYATRALMSDLPPPDPESLPRGGRLIGRLERAMIMMLVVAGQPDGIGFLIAAKSLLRFGDLAQDKDRRISEYVIIGTLASFAQGFVAAFATHLALQALGP